MYFKIKHPVVILSMTSSRKLLALAAITTLIGLASCQKDMTDDDGSPQPAAFTYKANINGSSWTATQNISLLVKNSSSSPAKEMRILANSSEGKQLSIKLADASTGIAGDGIAIRTYTLGGGSADASFAYSVNGSNNYTGAYGSVVITKSDAANKKLSGTFSCVLYKGPGDTLRVTGGVITDLPYTILEQ